MTTTLEKPPASARASLPGARMLRRALWLAVVASLSWFAYSRLLLASKGATAGGVDGSGNYLDAAGHITDSAPIATSAVMRANPAIGVLLSAIVVAAIIFVLRLARDEATAVRILGRATIVVAAVALCALVGGYAWFEATPLTAWTDSGIHFTGFPFATVSVTTEPIAR